VKNSGNIRDISGKIGENSQRKWKVNNNKRQNSSKIRLKVKIRTEEKKRNIGGNPRKSGGEKIPVAV
jgi:hypothetical protein